MNGDAGSDDDRGNGASDRGDDAGNRDGDRGDDRPTDRHVAPMDADECPSEVVVRAVAAVTDRSPLEVRPLRRVVDPDALDALFRPPGTDRRADRFSFPFAGCEVTVEPDRVLVREMRSFGDPDLPRTDGSDGGSDDGK